jgi:hypothetical protein
MHAGASFLFHDHPKGYNLVLCMLCTSMIKRFAVKIKKFKTMHGFSEGNGKQSRASPLHACPFWLVKILAG